MIGRKQQTALMQQALNADKSSFIAVTGRWRVGKTYLIAQVYANNFCLLVTGIQAAGKQAQINNFAQKIAAYASKQIVVPPANWQQILIELKNYLRTLSKKKAGYFFRRIALDKYHKIWVFTNDGSFME